MPIFIHAMIAACASFLLKMAVVFSERNGRNENGLHLPKDLAKYGLTFHTKNVLKEVEGLVSILSAVADKVSQQHVVRHVVTSLKEFLQRFYSGGDTDDYVYLGSGGRGARSIEHSATATNYSTNGYERDSTRQVDDYGLDHSFSNAPGQANRGAPLASLDQQDDPFNLLGNPDWRFNDAFLWGMQTEDSYM
jgi:hypothetical protein